MKGVKIFIMCALLFLLERVLFARFEILSVTPWLLFTFCLLSGAFSDDIKRPILISAIAGLLADLTGGGTVGTAMVSFALSSAAVYFLVRKIFHSSMLIMLLAVFFVGMGGEMLYFWLNSFDANGFSAVYILWRTALPLAFIDTVFALIIYLLANRIFVGRREI